MRPPEAAAVPILLRSEADPDDVLAIDREVVLDGDPTSRAKRQVDADRPILVQPGMDRIGVSHRPKTQVADHTLADSLRRRQVALDQGG